MTIEECPICKMLLYSWRLPHTCAPLWEAIIHDYHDEEEPIKIYSTGDCEKDVAEEFASLYHSSCDYSSEMEVWVRKTSDDEWKKFTVTVEQVPSYQAEPLSTPSA